MEVVNRIDDLQYGFESSIVDRVQGTTRNSRRRVQRLQRKLRSSLSQSSPDPPRTILNRSLIGCRLH